MNISRQVLALRAHRAAEALAPLPLQNGAVCVVSDSAEPKDSDWVVFPLWVKSISAFRGQRVRVVSSFEEVASDGDRGWEVARMDSGRSEFILSEWLRRVW